MPISPDEYWMWWNNDITKKIVKLFEEEMEHEMNELVAGRTLVNDAGATAERTAHSVGKLHGLNHIFTLGRPEEDEI